MAFRMQTFQRYTGAGRQIVVSEGDAFSRGAVPLFRLCVRWGGGQEHALGVHRLISETTKTSGFQPKEKIMQ